MIRKQKWEIEFEEYNEQEEILKINELSAKFKEKNITKEEYKELKKSYAKYKNIKKVANIIELKKQLETERKKLDKEIKELKQQEEDENKNKKAIEDNEKIEGKLEEELNGIQQELTDVLKKLKSNNLSVEDRKELESKKTELMKKRDDNNKKFAESQKMLSSNKDNKITKNKKDIKELEEKRENIGIKIGKCCFVGRLLMVGKNWDDIQIKINENQKYTSKDSKLNDKVKEESKKTDKQIDTTLKETAEQIGKDVKAIKEDEKKEKENAENEETSLVKTTEFQEKHPRLAKIFAAIKKILPRKNKKQENIIEQEVNTKQKETKMQRDEFLDYLKVVSEKGVNQANKDEAKAKLTENKKAAYARETEKFGKEYAERSYKEDIEIDDWRDHVSVKQNAEKTDTEKLETKEKLNNEGTQLVNNSYISLMEKMKKDYEKEDDEKDIGE